MNRDFSKVKRVVVKVGTNTLASGTGVDKTYLQDMAAQIMSIKNRGLQVLLVTSGAIGMGTLELGLAEKPTEVRGRQACAAVGQPLLMAAYKEAFDKFKQPIAQILLTNDVLSARTSFLKSTEAVDTLLGMGVIPIFNENDAVSIAEIGKAFGDNDKLSALVASKMDAELLIILSDIDALYDRDPRKFPEARRIPLVETITAEILEGAGGAGSAFSTGGMRTKIRAVLIAEKAGCATVLAHGREAGVLPRIVAGEDVGTLFLAKDRQPSRRRWILNSHPVGNLTVDEGAMAALRSHKSLLSRGLTKVEGDFSPGSVVLVNKILKLVTKFSSADLNRLKGLDSPGVVKILGKKDVIARPEDMAWVDEI